LRAGQDYLQATNQIINVNLDGYQIAQALTETEQKIATAKGGK
jgi:hypothetical protein